MPHFTTAGRRKWIVVELSEHDASKLLALVKRQQRAAPCPCWQHLAGELDRSIERYYAARWFDGRRHS